MRRRVTSIATARGMTFMEVLLAITIMLVLLSLALPKMGGMFRKGRLQADARILTGVLRYGRHAAVLSGLGTQIVIDPVEGRYRLQIVEIEGDGSVTVLRPGEYPKTVRLSDDVRGEKLLSKDVFFTMIHSGAELSEGEYPRIIFYPDGSASPASIGLQNKQGKAVAISVYRTTGMARVEEGHPVLPRNVRPLYLLEAEGIYEDLGF